MTREAGGEMIRVRLRNVSSDVVRASFATQFEDVKHSKFWRIVTGPPTLGPGHGADYVLAPPDGQATIAVPRGAALYVMSDDPQTVTVTRVTGPP